MVSGLALCAALWLAACSALPEYRAPGIDLPDRYSSHVARPAELSTADRLWWQDFGDPVLAHLVSAALSESPTLAEARARVVEAEALAGAPRGVLGDANAEIRRNSDGSESADLGLSAIFDLSGERRASKQAARARADAAQAAGIDARRLLVGSLATAYVDLRYAQARLAQRHQDQTSRQSTLRDIRTRAETGAATELEVLRAGAILAETQADIPVIEAAILRQRNRISTLIGRPASALDLDLGYPGHQPLPHDHADVGVPADLLRRRPDIVRAERAYAAAIADLGAAEAARYPTLSLSGLIRAPSGGTSDTSLAAGLTLPVFSQGTLKAEARAAHARTEAALAAWRGAVLVAVEEVESGLAAVHGAARSAQAAEKSVSLNNRALTLTREILETGGEATSLDLLDRERELSNARGLLAQSRRDIALEYISLRTALAGDLGIDETVVPEIADSAGTEPVSRAETDPAMLPDAAEGQGSSSN